MCILVFKLFKVDASFPDISLRKICWCVKERSESKELEEKAHVQIIAKGTNLSTPKPE